MGRSFRLLNVYGTFLKVDILTIFFFNYEYCTGKITVTIAFSLEYWLKMNRSQILVDFQTFATDLILYSIQYDSMTVWFYLKEIQKRQLNEKSDEKSHHVTAPLGIIWKTTISFTQIIYYQHSIFQLFMPSIFNMHILLFFNS